MLPADFCLSRDTVTGKFRPMAEVMWPNWSDKSDKTEGKAEKEKEEEGGKEEGGKEEGGKEEGGKEEGGKEEGGKEERGKELNAPPSPSW